MQSVRSAACPATQKWRWLKVPSKVSAFEICPKVFKAKHFPWCKRRLRIRSTWNQIETRLCSWKWNVTWHATTGTTVNATTGVGCSNSLHPASVQPLVLNCTNEPMASAKPQSNRAGSYQIFSASNKHRLTVILKGDLLAFLGIFCRTRALIAPRGCSASHGFQLSSSQSPAWNLSCVLPLPRSTLL